MTYTPLFDPEEQSKARGSRPEGEIAYVYDPPEIALAVNVALATNRPLLVRGDPGSGKSSLARDIAWCLDRRYEVEVITSRTQAQDLQWRFDAVRRLADVQAKMRKKFGGEHDAVYVEPGILWRAFDLESALKHGEALRATQDRNEPLPEPDKRGVVVLLDEIDKADPDVPNDLLVALDARWFRVPEIGIEVKARTDLDLLLILTTNGERELPAAFVRRCVVFDIARFDIARPDDARLKKIAARHFKKDGIKEDSPLLSEIYTTFLKLSGEANASKRRLPSTAEFLDAVRACLKLGITGPTDEQWITVTDAALWKHAPRGKDKP